ncbi:Ras-GEF domain-containing family member 1B-A [Aphelenchoides fujianensis]|nr:Ras-GEF domain-containing family member 1B-A [Aphelenchoides fujianensis]
MAINTRHTNGIPSVRSSHALSVPRGSQPPPAKPPSMSISSASNVSPEPARFNPFAPTAASPAGSNLTLSSVDSNNLVLDADGTILSAGPDAIWKKLLPTREYSPPRRFVFSMLLNLRSFVSPAEVIQKLIQSSIFEQNSNSANFRKNASSRLFHNVFEFVEDELFSLCTVASEDRRRIDGLMEALHSALGRREHYENALRQLRPLVEDPPEKSPVPCGLMMMATPLVVAEQLAQIEMERLQMIGPDEIVEMLTHSTLDNLQQHKRHRVRAIEWFIDLGVQCVNIANFNSLMAIVAGLTTSAVGRLKRTWTRVDRAKLEILQHRLNPSSNFSSYRATERVIIPFFGLLLKDLYYINRACLEPLPNGHLNLAMFTQLGDNMRNLVQWKSRSCPFKRNPSVLQYVLLGATYSERNMMLLSYEWEAPDTASEREEFKKLSDERDAHMRFVLLSLLLIPVAFASNPLRIHRLDGTDPVTCLKCEGVVEFFHFLNDAIIGGVGQEDLKNDVLELLCGDPPIDQTFCDEIRQGPLWDFLDCPELKVIQHDCEL